MFGAGLFRRGRWLVIGLASTLALTMAPLTAANAHPGHEHPATDAKVLIFTATTQFRHEEAIVQGTPVLQEAFSAVGIDSVHTEDASVFTDAGLAEYDALVMFQTSGDPWNADQKAAMERYEQAGGGIVAVHNATDMRGDYAWWDDLIGSTMPGHASTGSSPGQAGTVRVEDRTHPSTEHLDQRWERADEWYNYSTNVRGDAHVLATMDESTYDPGGNAMGADHPISWCKPYDGGRAWVTGMGHFGAHYTNEPALVQHIVGGVQWAAGLSEGDCGGTDWSEFEKVSLDTNTSAPFAMDVAPDGRVFYTEIVRGEIRVYDPQKQTTSTAVTIPVYSGGEDGLLGIALPPDFDTTGHLFVYYSPESANNSDPANFFNRVSRFTVAADSTIDPATENIVLEVPASRLPDEPGHTGGGLGFDAQGNLYLSVGDDVNPHSEPSGGYAPLSTRPNTFHDARATSANTNDLRGKLLRITPQPDGTYTIPEGNLFASGTAKTLPEIYAMGFRNPFRFSIDQETGAIGLADYSPDNGSDNPDRGPAGIAEWNYITEPGNFGWPLCMGDNEPFRDVDYTTSPVTVGDYFDCDAPVNDSPRNTGLTELPPVQAASMSYGYQRSSVPGVINQGGGLAPMGGPFYDYNPDLDSDTKFPAYYDGKPFFYEWARNRMYSITLSDSVPGAVEKVNPFLPPPAAEFLAPIDSKFGPDGAMYVLDWGGGFGRDNPSSGLHRIDYISGSRSPEAVATATPDTGPAPLAVQLDGSGSTDPEQEALTYAWDFDADGTTDSTEVTATHTYTETGVYDARLTVTDPNGKVGTTTVPITVGNTRPEISFVEPPNGAFFHFGDEVSWDLTVSDAEDTTIADADIIIQPALGHDEHAHPGEPLSGRTGTVEASLGGGHSDDTNVFYVLDGRYTDSGGAEGVPALTGSDTTILYSMQREAEFSSASDGMTTSASRDVEGGGSVVGGQDGAWAEFDPINLVGVDQLALRYASATDGTIEVRRDAPDGPLLATAQVESTGGLSRFADVVVDVDDTGESFALYLVLPGEGERRLNFFEAIGKGVSEDSRPTVAITAPSPDDVLESGEVQVTADAADTDHAISQVEFFADGVSIGADTEAPYEATWLVTTEKTYQLIAVATNDQDSSTTSRIVVAQVGELFGDLEAFSNVDGEFEQIDDGTYQVTSGGANMWQGVDEYSSLYLPATADEDWTATVQVQSQGNSAGSAKAGLFVRNDVTQPGQSAGYAALGMRPSGGFEWLQDGDGNGTLDTSSSASSTSYPAWVRITRDGDDYTAYWSKDGVTFTAVGDPVTLPGAASVQDIGMFVTAHSGTATSEVVFSDFDFDTEPPAPDPDPEPEPEVLPACLVTQSDEFDGDALNGKRWSVQRLADGQQATVAGGALSLPVPLGDINEDVTGPINFVGQPAAAGAWAATTQVTLEHTREWQHAGLMLHSTDDDYVKLAFTRNVSGGRFLEFQTEADGVRATHDGVNLPTEFPSTVHLRLSSDGAAVTAAYSTDGVEWTELEGAAVFAAGANLGLVVAGDTGASEVSASFESFRVTPDREDDGERSFADEFEGDALDGCRWNQTVRYDSGNVAVAEGELRITTQPGDINNANPISPQNCILQAAPGGDWTIETRLKASMAEKWQYAGLLAYDSDDDYVKLDVVASNAPGAPVNLGAELVAETDGGFGSGGNRALDIADSSESGWWYLRLARTGDTYTGWISDGGINWTPLGAPVMHAGELSSLGLVAVGPEQVTPVTVAFDYIRVLDDEPVADTTAPTVTVAVDPAEPDGAKGWWRAPVAVSLIGADAESGLAGLEYQVDGGAFVPYTAAVPVDEGVHVYGFRASDVAGNVSPVATVSVGRDATAPLTAASFAPGNDAGWSSDAVPVVLTASDAGSGVISTEYSVEGGAWLPYDGASVTVSGDGVHTIEFRSTDAAGNVEETKAATIKIDGTLPTILVSGIAHGQIYGDSREFRISWTGTDETSGIQSVTAALDETEVENDRLFALYELPLGIHDLVVTGTDNAGNTTTQTITFFINTSFEDMVNLIDRFRATGRLDAAQATDLQKQLGKARQQEAKGKVDKAVVELAKFRDLLSSQIVEQEIIDVLTRDADAMIERFGGTSPGAGDRPGKGKDKDAKGRLPGDPDRKTV